MIGILEICRNLMPQIVFLLGSFLPLEGGQPNLAGSQASPAGVLVLLNATVIDGTGAPPKPGMALLIRNGMILDLGTKDRISVPPDARVLDLGGQWVIPGLIDGHVHLRGLPENHLEFALRWGITSLRSMGDDAEYLAELIRAIKEGKAQGPGIFYSAMFSGRRTFEEDSRPQLVTPPRFRLGEAPWARAIDEKTDIPKVIREAKACGASGIKLINNLPPWQIQRIVKEAHRQGMKVWSHVVMATALPGDIASAGVDSMSHGLFLPATKFLDKTATESLWIDPEVLESRSFSQTLKTMQKKHLFLDPTFSAGNWIIDRRYQGEQNDRRKKLFVEVVRRAYHAHVPIVAGTDVDLPAAEEEQPALFREMEILVEQVGMSPLEVITAATLNGAQVIGIEKNLGTLEGGKAADLVVLRKNPLEDIGHVREVAWVFKDGAIVRQPQTEKE